MFFGRRDHRDRIVRPMTQDVVGSLLPTALCPPANEPGPGTSAPQSWPPLIKLAMPAWSIAARHRANI
jgi:hypothetical protein